MNSKEEKDFYEGVIYRANKKLHELEKLEKENKELNRQLDVFFNKLDKNTIRAIDLISYDLLDENTKLKKALEILKEVVSLNCDKTLETERQFLRLSKEEYELLKEVLSNDKQGNNWKRNCKTNN